MSLKTVYESFDTPALITEGRVILETRVKPLLKESVEYNRISSFFSPTLLKAIFKELAYCMMRGGKIKFIIGIHEGSKLIPVLEQLNNKNPEEKFVTAVSNILKNDINECLKLIKNGQNINYIFAELIRQEFIELKFAAVRKDYDRYIASGVWPLDDSLFHPKVLIFKDSNFTVVGQGSINETNAGYNDHIENAQFINSWENKDLVEFYEKQFSDIWNGTNLDTRIIDLNNEFKNLLKEISNTSLEFKRLKQNVELQYVDFQTVYQRSPLFFSNYFSDVNLLPHQKAIYTAALSRWPVKALLSDEVGLGKTIEAGSIIKYLISFEKLNKIVLLVPASLCYQWQTELFNLFGLEFYVYEHNFKKLILKPNNKVLREISNVNSDNYFNHGVNKIIFSWHYIRSNNNGEYKLKSTDNIDLMLVDEAHAARIKLNSDETYRKTELYAFLENILPSIKHKLLLTATPQQTDIYDYLGLLKLLLSDLLITEDSFKRIAKINSNSRVTQNDKIEAMLELSALKNSITSIQFNPFDDTDPRSILNSFLESIYIKNHPTTIFTLRNTRVMLSDIGYTFPEISLFSKPIELNSEQIRIIELVEYYIDNILFIFEQSALAKKGLGFVKTIYSQRLVSSFKACYDSLNSRKIRLEQYLATNNIPLGEFEDEDNEGEDLLNELAGQFILTEDLTNLAKRDIDYIAEILLLFQQKIFKDDTIFDPKIEFAFELIQKHLLLNEQILVFSRFTSTTNFIVQKLKVFNPTLKIGKFQGDSIQIIIGNSISNETRTSISNSFRRGEIPIIICSDAASEGLNLQTASVLINLDVPWNPARLLQRFGRVDRFGQKKAILHFYNLFYPNTIEDRMYTRLHNRNQDFRKLLGSTPEITSSEHIEDLTFSQHEIDIDNLYEYKNTLIKYEINSNKRIHELILEKLNCRNDIKIDNDKIYYDGLFLEYSINEIENNYLNLNHSIFTFLKHKSEESYFPVFILQNGKEIPLLYLIKLENGLFPILDIEVILDLFILNIIRITEATKLYNESDLNFLLFNILKDNSNIVINHNNIIFDNDNVISIYEDLTLKKIGNTNSYIV